MRSRDDELLLGEWACLGIIAAGRTHGFAIASRLRTDGDLGRIWSLSRALTYRAIEQLEVRGFIEPVAVEPGRAGGSRTIYAATRAGRARLRRWVTTPVPHLRDLRSELLLKLALAHENGIDVDDMITRQRALVTDADRALADAAIDRPDDLVARWRHESSQAALRFLDSL